jgi:hypothetical protein
VVGQRLLLTATLQQQGFDQLPPSLTG